MLQTNRIDLNILPPQYRPRGISLAQVLIPAALLILLLGLAPAFLALSVAQAQTTSRRAQLAGLKAALAQPQDLTKLDALQKQLDQAHAEIERLHIESQTVNVRQPLRAPGIEAAIASLNPRVELLIITQNGRLYSVTGQAGSQALVLDYARSLQASTYFTVVRIVSMLNADPLGVAPDVRFVIEMTQ
jgi:Tfp pilus assembly protein PilN